MTRRTSIHGMDELTRVLRAAPGKVLNETEKSLFKAAGVVKRAAQANAPVGRKRSLRWRKAKAKETGVEGAKEIARAGRLKRNILVKKSRGFAKSMGLLDKEQIRAVAVYVRFSRQRKKWDPKNAWYAHFVEWGTKRTSAKPFLTPAWQAHDAEAQRQIEAGAKAAINKIRAGT